MMAGNKALIADLALLRAFVRVVTTCLREGVPLPVVFRVAMVDMADRVRSAKTKEG